MRAGNMFTFMVKKNAILGADYSGVIVAKGSTAPFDCIGRGRPQGTFTVETCWWWWTKIQGLGDDNAGSSNSAQNNSTTNGASSIVVPSALVLGAISLMSTLM